MKVRRLWDISIEAGGKFPIKKKYCLKWKVLCKYFLNPDTGLSMGSSLGRIRGLMQAMNEMFINFDYVRCKVPGANWEEFDKSLQVKHWDYRAIKVNHWFIMKLIEPGSKNLMKEKKIRIFYCNFLFRFSRQTIYLSKT